MRGRATSWCLCPPSFNTLLEQTQEFIQAVLNKMLAERPAALPAIRIAEKSVPYGDGKPGEQQNW